MNQGKRRTQKKSESEPASTLSKRKAESNNLDEEDLPTQQQKKPELAPIWSSVAYTGVRDRRKDLFNPDSVFSAIDHHEAEDKFAKTFLEAFESSCPKADERKHKDESDAEDRKKLTPKTTRRRKKRQE